MTPSSRPPFVVTSVAALHRKAVAVLLIIVNSRNAINRLALAETLWLTEMVLSLKGRWGIREGFLE